MTAVQMLAAQLVLSAVGVLAVAAHLAAAGWRALDEARRVYADARDAAGDVGWWTT